MYDSSQTLTEDQVRTTNIVSDVVSSLSLTGSALILFHFFWLQKGERTFALRLVASLSLADMMYQICDYIQPSPESITEMNNGGKITATCWIQAIGDSFFELASVLWTAAIATTSYCAIVRGWKESELERLWRPFLLVCWGIPLLLTLLPLSTKAYGPAGAWCWIVSDQAYWQFIQFFGPLWLVILYNTVLCYQSLKMARQRAKASEGAVVDAATAAAQRAMNRLPLYPLILLFTWGSGSVNRIYEAATRQQIFGLYFFQKIMTSSQGFLNSIAYGLGSPKMVASVKRNFGRIRDAVCLNRCKHSTSSDNGAFKSKNNILSPPSAYTQSSADRMSSNPIHISESEGLDEEVSVVLPTAMDALGLESNHWLSQHRRSANIVPRSSLDNRVSNPLNNLHTSSSTASSYAGSTGYLRESVSLENSELNQVNLELSNIPTGGNSPAA